MLLNAPATDVPIPTPSVKAAAGLDRFLLGVVGYLRHPDEYLPARISVVVPVREMRFDGDAGLTAFTDPVDCPSAVPRCC
ncbi:hypothetical protein KCP74_00965 [Salmonella enterica subsp. enterica]|nr:hypothetical protein KCP74_00965 [Salmonella enterica subsp. enterica]